jgi:hypothetical protein
VVKPEGVAFPEIRGQGCPGKQDLIFTNSKIKCPSNAPGIFPTALQWDFTSLISPDYPFLS